MNRMKSVAVVLTGVLLLNTAGIVILLKALQWQARMEVESQAIDRNSLQQFVFTVQTFKKISIREGREMDWMNIRYDIVNTKIKHGHVYVQAFPDKKETYIVKHIKKILLNTGGKHRQQQELEYTLSLLLLCFIPPQSPVVPRFEAQVVSTFDAYLNRYTDFLPSATTPPPQYSLQV